MGLTGSWEEGGAERSREAQRGAERRRGAYLDLLRQKKINCICIGIKAEMGVEAIPILFDT